MKLTTVVITAGHAESFGASAGESAALHSRGAEGVFVWFNSGGDEAIGTVARQGPNVGNYPVFHRAAEHIDSDLLFFIHDDFIIHEEGYDRRFIEAFEADDKLGLVGVIGSEVFDPAGGRGRFSYSNFQGLDGGSPAEAHGQRFDGYMAAANVDGCAMCFRRDMLLELPFKEDFPLFHWYDRLLCAQTLEAGYHVGLLGIACDHISSQTSCSYQGWFDLAQRWCEERGIYREGANGWDHQVYLEGEDQFLREYLDGKRFIPLRVGSDHTVYHTHPLRGLAA